MSNLDKARVLAVAVPAALLAGALGSQYLGGLHPCEMCHWQRWGHYTALALGLLAFVPALRSGVRLLVGFAAAAILSSGAIGIYHAEVEAGVFEGITQCTAGISGGSSADILADIMATPLVRCDQVQWSLFGISMAGWNAILSTGFALMILWLLLRRSGARA